MTMARHYSRWLIACEWSGEVRDQFLAHGIEAYSCDVEQGYGIHTDHHIRADVRTVLTMGWAGMIAFPPCTYLTTTGARIWRDSPYQEHAINFVDGLLNAPIERIALENPPGAYSNIRSPDQIFEPWYFGHPFTKRTCLWLNNLPPLQPENMCHPGDIIGSWTDYVRSPKSRGRTFNGVAKAMARQWGSALA